MLWISVWLAFEFMPPTALDTLLLVLSSKGGKLRKSEHKQNVNCLAPGAVVVAQLAEWSLSIPEDRGSNPVIGKVLKPFAISRIVTLPECQ